MSERKTKSQPVIKENVQFFSDAAWNKWREKHWSPLLEFAENHYVIGDDGAVPGAFSIINSPYLAEPFRAWCDAQIREITLQLAAQLGKNMFTEILMSYIPLHNPGNVLFYAQTDDDAEEFMQKRALPRMRSIDVLRYLMPMEGTKGHRKAERDCSIILPHMWIEPYGANESNTRGKSAPWVMNDELHIEKQWTKGMRSKCNERRSAFPDGKTLNTSTAGNQGSEIDLAFKEGTQEVWAQGCPDCEKLVFMKWNEKPRMISWEPLDGEKGWARMYPERKEWNFQEVRKNLRFICPHCGFQHRDSVELRREMNRLAEYVVTNKNASPDHRSFRASQLAAWWKPYEVIAERWIKARELQKTGDLKELRLFIIEALGETWENQITPGTQGGTTGAYELSKVFEWEMEHMRFLTGDVQEKGSRHIWCVIRAWAIGGESRLVAARRCESWTEVREFQQEYEVPKKQVGIDARFRPKEVQEVCAQNGWTWLQADEGENRVYDHPGPGGSIIKKPHGMPKHVDVFIGTNRQGQLYARGLNYSKHWVREVLHNRIMGFGTRWELPIDVDTLKFKGTRVAKTSYKEQINSWIRGEETDKKTNEKFELWKQVYADDHLRACEEEQIIMAALAKIVPLDVVGV